MSFTIKSIELKNIRAHEYFLFEPAPEGTTAISGPNGSGKSSIIDAFAWCLYGTRPTGVKNRNLIRDGVDPREKPVSVKAIVNIGGIEYAIERKIVTPHGAVECNVWGRKPGSKKVTQVAGPSVTHVEKFIRNEIGMNEKGFLTSVLIQQKQVDQIVSATPRERGVVIEELTGIASITQAIDKVNENTRGLEKAASIFQIGNIDEAEEKVNKQKEVCQSMEEKEKDAIAKFNEVKKYYAEIKQQLQEEEVKVNKRIKLTQDIEAYKKQIDFLKKQAEDDLEYISNFKDKYGSTVVMDTNKLKNDVANKRQELYEEESKQTSESSRLREIERNLENCNVLKGSFENEKDAQEILKSQQDDLNKKQKQLEDLREKESMYASEIKHSKASHEHIDGKDKNCPVCKSAIDDPETLKKEIEKELKEYESKRKDARKNIKVLQNEIKELEEEIKKTNISIEAIKEEKRLLIERDEVKKNLNEITTKIGLLRRDLKSLESNYDKALRIEADKNALESAKARSLTVHETIKKNEDLMNDAKEKIKKLGAMTDRSYNALVKRVEETKDKLDRMSIAGREIRGRKNLEYERLGDYEKDLKQVQEAMKKYNELAKQIEISTSASAMLSRFKADRIEHAIPTLEFYASDFLSKFTGGAFAKMTVDEKFNTFVTTSKGAVRPVAQLSGGELSAAAIALRLGIAMLLNSSEKNVLILDEVLVSMDEDRARQIMETISSMTNSQIIFIAHNSDINSIADKTVLVTKE